VLSASITARSKPGHRLFGGSEFVDGDSLNQVRLLLTSRVTAIINGKHPPQLSAKRLMRLALKLPTDWTEQRKLLGFEAH
jgi:hypothetical protein